MRSYEISIIFDASLEEEVIRAVLDRVTEAVRSRAGVPGQVDRWGRRRLAYELAHRWEGYYVFLEVSADVATMAEVDRMLSLADEVLRHKAISIPERMAGQRRSAAPPPGPAMAEAG